MKSNIIERALAGKLLIAEIGVNHMIAKINISPMNAAKLMVKEARTGIHG